jgi:ankyrin repeat protein
MHTRDQYSSTNTKSIEALIGGENKALALIKNSKNSDYRGPQRLTLLHIAAYYGFKEEAIRLIDEGARIDAEDDSWRTPLYYAKDAEMVKLLINKGAGVEVCNIDTRTPLIEAIINGKLGIVKALLENGADVDLCGPTGEVPILKAIDCANLEILKALVDKGVDLKVKDKNGFTPLEHTIRYHPRKRDFIKLLNDATEKEKCVQQEKTSSDQGTWQSKLAKEAQAHNKRGSSGKFG